MMDVKGDVTTSRCEASTTWNDMSLGVDLKVMVEHVPDRCHVLTQTS
jgi:hypothetical protein